MMQQKRFPDKLVSPYHHSERSVRNVFADVSSKIRQFKSLRNTNRDFLHGERWQYRTNVNLTKMVHCILFS